MVWDTIAGLGGLAGLLVSITSLIGFGRTRREQARQEGAFTQKVDDMNTSMKRAWDEIEAAKTKTASIERDVIESRVDLKYLKEKIDEISTTGKDTAKAVSDLASALAKL